MRNPGSTIVLGLVANTLALSPAAHASSVIASVQSNWSYNSGTQLYTYTYSLTNAANSPNPIRTLAIRPAARPLTCTSPSGWTCVRGLQGDSTAVAWLLANPGPPPPNWDGLPFVSDVYVAPGETLTGFSLTSEFSPDSTATFVAQGFDTIPSGLHSDAPVVLNPIIWDEGWVGAAVVPVLGNPVGVPSGLGDAGVRFYPPIPNPTRGSVDLQFSLPKGGKVELSMYDVAGRKLAVVSSGDRAPGPHRIPWNGTDSKGTRVPSGVYFYRLSFDGKPVGDRRVVVLP